MYKPSRCPKCGSKETRRDWDEWNDHYEREPEDPELEAQINEMWGDEGIGDT
jgi:hypothetical protein